MSKRVDFKITDWISPVISKEISPGILIYEYNIMMSGGN
jgi:hypothetical protein